LSCRSYTHAIRLQYVTKSSNYITHLISLEHVNQVIKPGDCHAMSQGNKREELYALFNDILLYLTM
jgi:hypothetical protein